MYLVTSEVLRARLDDIHDLVPFLSVQWKCPICERLDSAKGPTVRNARIMTLPQRAKQLVAALNTPQTCKRCGVVSALPEIDVEQLEQKVRAVVTDMWFREDVPALPREH